MPTIILKFVFNDGPVIILKCHRRCFFSQGGVCNGYKLHTTRLQFLIARWQDCLINVCVTHSHTSSIWYFLATGFIHTHLSCHRRQKSLIVLHSQA